MRQDTLPWVKFAVDIFCIWCVEGKKERERNQCRNSIIDPSDLLIIIVWDHCIRYLTNFCSATNGPIAIMY